MLSLGSLANWGKSRLAATSRHTIAECLIHILIREEAETLKKLLVQQKDKRRFERVQALYLLKIRQVETVEHLAVILISS